MALERSKDATEEQRKLCLAYATIVKNKRCHAGYVDLAERGITEDKVRYHFGKAGQKNGTLAHLRNKSKFLYPDAFNGIIDSDIFNVRTLKQLKSSAAKYKRFVITTAVTGCPVHKGFYKSLKTYCKRNKALLLVMTCSDPASRVPWTVDSALAGEQIVTQELALNDNLFLSTVKLSAKHIDPATSFDRIGQRNGSFIFASPKQRLKVVPTSNVKLPHALMTTGAITKPKYETDRYLSERTAYIATHDHVVGALVVEILDNKHFLFRQLQAEKSGNFVDLGVYYQGTMVGKLAPVAVDIGDLHAGETDPVADRAWKEAIRELGIGTALIEDGFNGLSINHHEEKDHILRAQRASAGQLSLEQELRCFAEAINGYCEISKLVVIKESNHNEFLKRYLKEARYVKDPHNHYLALKLAQAVFEGKNPVQVGVEMFGLKHPHKVKWLTRNDDFKVAGIELGAHGDKGANGAKGTLAQMEKAYGHSVTGHAHTPEILRGAWQVGTSSYLKLNYNEGVSSWMHASCLVYPNGSRQMLCIIDGKWRS